MKFMIDYGNGTVWSLLLPPNALFWAATILAVLVVVYWHYKLKHREIQSRELKEIRDDHRQKEIAGFNIEGSAGYRSKGSRGANDKSAFHDQEYRNLQ